MTATVHVLHEQATPALPLPPERRKLLLDWLAVEVTGGAMFVPEDVIDATLDAFACQSLTEAERTRYWESVLTWVDLREGLKIGRWMPDAVGCQDSETAEETAGGNAQDALSLLVHGNQSTARGSHSPRGTTA